jgi:hypothetical protein
VVTRCPSCGHGGSDSRMRRGTAGAGKSCVPVLFFRLRRDAWLAWVCLPLGRACAVKRSAFVAVVAGIVPGRRLPHVSSPCVRRRGAPPGGVEAVVVAGGGRGKQGHLVDALAPRGDEGRGTLRKALGSREQALIRGSPNGATPPSNGRSAAESIGGGGEPGELKHLSTRRKGHQPRLR